MSLTRLESETGINFNDEESFAIVYTSNAALKRKLDSLCKLHPSQFKKRNLVGDDEDTKSYHIPKKCVFIKTPSIFSEEAKIRMKAAGLRLSASNVKNTESTLGKKTVNQFKLNLGLTV